MSRGKSEADVAHRIRREQRGQTSAEYLGVLVAVGLIIAAILSSGVVGQLTGGIEAALCRILGGEGCEQQEQPEQEQTPPSDESPPPPTDSGRAEREVHNAQLRRRGRHARRPGPRERRRSDRRPRRRLGLHGHRPNV